MKLSVKRACHACMHVLTVLIRLGLQVGMDPSEAALSFAANGEYKAAGNLFWIDLLWSS